MQLYVLPSCAFLAITPASGVRIYEFLFIRFCRIELMEVVVVKFQLLLKVRVYIIAYRFHLMIFNYYSLCKFLHFRLFFLA